MKKPIRILSEHEFNAYIAKLPGVKAVTINGVDYWQGISLKPKFRPKKNEKGPEKTNN